MERKDILQNTDHIHVITEEQIMKKLQDSDKKLGM